MDKIQTIKAVEPSSARGDVSRAPLKTVTNTNNMVIRIASLPSTVSLGSIKVTHETIAHNPERNM